jgi:hypothetical protein
MKNVCQTCTWITNEFFIYFEKSLCFEKVLNLKSIANFECKSYSIFHNTFNKPFVYENLLQNVNSIKNR